VNTAVRWVVIVAASLLIVGLVAYARGPKHHHGQYVGSHGTRVVGVVHP
jgi:hypothetical protein